MQALDERTVAETVKRCEGLVRSTAHRISFVTGWRDPDAMCGVGRTAVWEAMRTHDPERGTLEDHIRARVWFDTFSYSRWMITGRFRGSSRAKHRFGREPLAAAANVEAPDSESDCGILLRAIRRVLSDREFRAVVDGYVLGLPAKDTAAALGCSAQAVADLRLRAMRTLRLLIADPVV